MREGLLIGFLAGGCCGALVTLIILGERMLCRVRRLQKEILDVRRGLFQLKKRMERR